MNRVLGHLCPHIGSTGQGETPEDGEMNEITLPSRHRIRNSHPGGMGPSSLRLGHGGSPQYWIFTSEQRRNFLFLWNLNVRAGFEPGCNLLLSNHAATCISLFLELEGNCDFSSSNNVWTKFYEFFAAILNIFFLLLWQIKWNFAYGFFDSHLNRNLRLQTSEFGLQISDIRTPYWAS